MLGSALQVVRHAWYAGGIEAIAGCLLGFWFVVSVLHQLKYKGFVSILKRHDHFALVPAWSFFAPNPGTTDMHLLYRDKLIDGKVTLWRQVRLHTSIARCLWNPDKRLQKGISDMGNDLHRFALNNRKTGEALLIYPAFIAVLNFVTHLTHPPFAEFTQFVIARSFGEHSTQDAEIMVMSSFHRLAPAPPEVSLDDRD